jgi:hypothetical protein
MRYARVLTGVLVVWMAAGPAGSYTRAAEPPKPDVTLELTAGKKEVVQGEPLPIQVRATNVGKQDVLLPISWSDGFFSGTVAFQGVTSEWSFRIRGYIDRVMRQRATPLKPGETYEQSVDFLQVAPAQRPGAYALAGTLESPGVVQDYINHVTTECWKGKATASPLRIEVKPPPTQADRDALKVLLAPWAAAKQVDYASMWYVLDHPVVGQDKRLQTVIEKYPDSVYAPYCRLYWAQAAAEVFDSADDTYEKCEKWLSDLTAMGQGFSLADRAELALAKLHLRKSRYVADAVARKQHRDQATKYLEHVIHAYPGRPAAEEAKALLATVLGPKQEPVPAVPPGMPPPTMPPGMPAPTMPPGTSAPTTPEDKRESAGG